MSYTRTSFTQVYAKAALAKLPLLTRKANVDYAVSGNGRKGLCFR